MMPCPEALSSCLALRDYSVLWRQVDSFQPELSQPWAIRADAGHRLAITFGPTVTGVRTDAHDVATWHDPNDDGQVFILAPRSASQGRLRSSKPGDRGPVWAVVLSSRSDVSYSTAANPQAFR
jgi:hypothetical protein